MSWDTKVKYSTFLQLQESPERLIAHSELDDGDRNFDEDGTFFDADPDFSSLTSRMSF